MPTPVKAPQEETTPETWVLAARNLQFHAERHRGRSDKNFRFDSHGELSARAQDISVSHFSKARSGSLQHGG